MEIVFAEKRNTFAIQAMLCVSDNRLNLDCSKRKMVLNDSAKSEVEHEAGCVEPHWRVPHILTPPSHRDNICHKMNHTHPM